MSSDIRAPSLDEPSPPVNFAPSRTCILVRNSAPAYRWIWFHPTWLCEVSARSAIATMAPRGRQPRAGSEVHTCAGPQAWLNQRQLSDNGLSGIRVSRVRLPVEDKQRHMTTSAGRNHGVGVGDLIVRRGQPSKRHNQCHPCSRSCRDNGLARTI
jgi:hypothetical protein